MQILFTINTFKIAVMISEQSRIKILSHYSNYIERIINRKRVKKNLLQILEALVQRGKLNQLKAIDISYTNALSENTIYKLIQKHGGQLTGLMLSGKPKLTENFWLNVIPLLKNIQ